MKFKELNNEQKDEIKRLHSENLTANEIGKRLGVTCTSMIGFINKLNLIPNRIKKAYPDQEFKNLIIKEYNKGKFERRISTENNINISLVRNTIDYYIKHHGLIRNKFEPRPQNLTQSVVKMYKGSDRPSIGSIAKFFNRDKKTIRKCLQEAGLKITCIRKNKKNDLLYDIGLRKCKTCSSIKKTNCFPGRKIECLKCVSLWGRLYNIYKSTNYLKVFDLIMNKDLKNGIEYYKKYELDISEKKKIEKQLYESTLKYKCAKFYPIINEKRECATCHFVKDKICFISGPNKSTDRICTMCQDIFAKIKNYSNNKLDLSKNNTELLLDIYNNKKWHDAKKYCEWRSGYKKEITLSKEPSRIIRKSVSCAIEQYFSNKNLSKGSSCFEKLPFTVKELRDHFESLFEPWMNWNNHGSYSKATWDDNDKSTWLWQTDHFTCHSMYEYSTMNDEHFKACWALSNLRPYSAKQNVIDGYSRIRHNHILFNTYINEWSKNKNIILKQELNINYNFENRNPVIIGNIIVSL